MGFMKRINSLMTKWFLLFYCRNWCMQHPAYSGSGELLKHGNGERECVPRGQLRKLFPHLALLYPPPRPPRLASHFLFTILRTFLDTFWSVSQLTCWLCSSFLRKGHKLTRITHLIFTQIPLCIRQEAGFFKSITIMQCLTQNEVCENLSTISGRSQLTNLSNKFQNNSSET